MARDISRGIFPTPSTPIYSNSYISNGQPPLESTDPSSVVPLSSLLLPPSMVPPSSSQLVDIPPKEPMVVDPSSSQKNSNKTKHYQHAHECQKNCQACTKACMNASHQSMSVEEVNHINETHRYDIPILDSSGINLDEEDTLDGD